MVTVLLVESNAATAHTYAESLERAGFHVETIASERDALDLPPDLVVLSVPRLERSLLRIFAHGIPVPRIVLSSEAADAARAAEFECAAVLIRPVMYDTLVKEARRVLKESRARQFS
jgi:DNA-binding response OmpR family regulator